MDLLSEEPNVQQPMPKTHARDVPMIAAHVFVPESEKWKKAEGSGATSHWATQDLLGVLIGLANWLSRGAAQTSVGRTG